MLACYKSIGPGHEFMKCEEETSVSRSIVHLHDSVCCVVRKQLWFCRQSALELSATKKKKDTVI